jgi:hypothetical protein
VQGVVGSYCFSTMTSGGKTATMTYVNTFEMSSVLQRVHLSNLVWFFPRSDQRTLVVINPVAYSDDCTRLGDVSCTELDGCETSLI